MAQGGRMETQVLDATRLMLQSPARTGNIKNRSYRRTGRVSPKYGSVKGGRPQRPRMSDDEGFLFDTGLGEEEEQTLEKLRGEENGN